jgi:thiosulfate/3-mercaptopyruvate sulfurtransferase
MIELISAQELKLKLGNGDKLSVIDARRLNLYEAGHIPGAINMLWESWCEDAPAQASEVLHQPGWWGKLARIPDLDLEQKLAAIGLNSDHEIIVYSDGITSKGRDGRIAWMLLYFGAQRVFMLDGGWNAWLAISDDAELELPDANESCFAINFDHTRRISLEELRSIWLEVGPFGVDTRTREEFAGIIYDYQPRLGHIPNSINIPFSTLYANDGKFLNREEFLKNLQLNGLDINRHSRQLDYSYCEVGVRAATFSLLFELYTGRKLPVYDASFMEWAFNEDLPIACADNKAVKESQG